MRWMLGLGAAALLAGSALAGSALAAPPIDPQPSLTVQAAVNDPSRPEKDVKLDPSRKPADIVAFAGVKPGDKVLDIWTGSGYWSRIFGKVVGPTGVIYAYVPEEIAGFKSKPVDVAKAVAAEPGRGNIQAISDPAGSQPPPQYENTLDVAFIFENYHDLHDSFMKHADGTLVDVDAYNRAIFKLLKPGGVYVIVDHVAPAGSGLKNTEDLHRIDPATLRAEVQKAGFVFDGESKVLANPDDPHTALVFDPSIRGKTDRFAYRFMKPR